MGSEKKKRKKDADFCEDADGESHHPRGRAQRLHRERQGQDPGQGRHSSGSAAFDLRWQAARGWSDSLRLQHPERVDAPSRPASQRRHHRAFTPHVGAKVQLRENDLPQMLRQTPAKGDELPQEKLRTHQQSPPQEEAEVNGRSRTSSPMSSSSSSSTRRDGAICVVADYRLSSFLKNNLSLETDKTPNPLSICYSKNFLFRKRLPFDY